MCLQFAVEPYISGNTSFYAIYTWFARYNVTYSRNDPTYVDPNAPVKPTWTVIDWTPWFEGTGDDQAAILNQLNSLPQVQQDTALEEYGLFEEYYANLGPVGDPVSETRSFYALTTNAVLPRITITLPRAADFGWTVEGYCLDKWLDEEDQAYRAGTEVAIAGDTSFSATWAVPPRFMFTLGKNDPSFDANAVWADYQNGRITAEELNDIFDAQTKHYTILGDTVDETERLYTLPTAASLGWANSGQLRLVGWEFTDNTGNRIKAYDGATITLRAGWVWTLTAKWGYPVGNNTYLSIDKNGNLTDSWYTGDYSSIPASITLPTSVKSLGQNSLAGLRTKRVVIPNSVTNLDYRACYWNSYVESVVIPGSVKTIGGEAFNLCVNLREVTIKDGVESIGYDAFSSLSNLSGTFTLPSSVTNIGYHAFFNCKGLTGLVIRGDDVKLGEGAFAGCSALESVSFGGGGVGYRAFKDCSELKRFNFGKVKTIGSYAFDGCRKLRSVETGDDLTTIGQYAFNNCWEITDIVLSSNLSTMETGSFANCQSLTSVTVRAAVVPSGAQFTNYSQIRYVSLGEGIAPGAGKAAVPAGDSSPFRSNNIFGYADTVVLGHGIATIGSQAFKDNTRLKSVRIDGASIGQYAFQDCTGLTNVVFGSGVTNTGGYSFYGCTALKDIRLGTGINVIGQGSFHGCSALTHLEISNVNTILDGAFAYCDGLKSVTIGDGVREVCTWAFQDCTALERITFGRDVLSIYSYVVNHCYNLRTVMLLSKPNLLFTSGSSFTWGGFRSGCVFWLPEGLSMPGIAAVPHVTYDRTAASPLKNVVYCLNSGSSVRPADVYLEIPSEVESMTVQEGSKALVTSQVSIMNGDIDITSSLGTISVASGSINLASVEVKQEIVQATLDVEQGAVVEMDPEEPVLTTSETVPGLTYTLMEGSSLEDMRVGDSKVGDGSKWTPNVTVKGGSSGFYTIRVGK